MKIRFFLPLFALLLAALPARATVLIYQGTLSRFRSDDTPLASTGKCLIALDVDAKQVVILEYGKVDGVKKRDLGSTYNVLPALFTRSDGKMQFVFSRTQEIELFNMPAGNSALFLRGTQKPLVIRRVGGSDIIVPGPKALGGTYRFVSLGAVIEVSYTATYDEVRSVPANNAMKTLAQVLADLRAELEARGFGI